MLVTSVPAAPVSCINKDLYKGIYEDRVAATGTGNTKLVGAETVFTGNKKLLSVTLSS